MSASQKFTVLNPKGASGQWLQEVVPVSYTLIQLEIWDYASELGNYEEYSGAPNEEVLQYARVVLDAITAAGTRKNESIFGELHTQLKNKILTVDVKANSGKELSVGVDVSFDTATSNFTKYNAALSLTNSDLIASLHLNNHGDTLTASYYHLVKQHSSTAVGAELSHSFSRNESTLIFGSQHSLDPHTTVKTQNLGMSQEHRSIRCMTKKRVVMWPLQSECVGQLQLRDGPFTDRREKQRQNNKSTES